MTEFSREKIKKYISLLGCLPCFFCLSTHGQNCTYQAAPNTLAATYPQLITCSAAEEDEAIMALSDAPFEIYDNNTFPTSIGSSGAVNGVVDKFMHPDWTLGSMGPIYFVEWDKEGSIYAPASLFQAGYAAEAQSSQLYKVPGIIGSAYANTAIGGYDGFDVIYKTDPLTGEPFGWALLETNDQGFGGITFDPNTESIYVVNMGDYTIYQLGASGTIISSFTPSLTTTDFNDSELPSVQNFQNRPFGLDIHGEERRLYYTVIRADNKLEVRSVGLTPTGTFAGDDTQALLESFVSNFKEEGPPVIADIDISNLGKMVVGSFTSNDFDNNDPTFYHGDPSTIYNHNSSVYGFEKSNGNWIRSFVTSVGQEDYGSGSNNATATGGVAWNIDPSLPQEMVWMSGGDFDGEDSNWGIIGYNYNELGNTNNQEDASSYVQWLFEDASFGSDPKGNGGDVDVYGHCIFCSVFCEITNTVNETCANASNGGISVNATIIDPTITNVEYSIDGGNTWVSNPNFGGLSKGNYVVQVREVGDESCSSCAINLECVNQTEQFGDVNFIGNATAASTGGDDPQHLVGTIEPAGTAINGNSMSGNSTLINGNNSSVSLVFNEILPVGGILTISLADNNGNGNVTISDGSPAGDIIFSGGTEDELQHIIFNLTQATNTITITRNGGSVWVDGASYDFTANVSLGFTCDECPELDCGPISMPKVIVGNSN